MWCCLSPAPHWPPLAATPHSVSCRTTRKEAMLRSCHMWPGTLPRPLCSVPCRGDPCTVSGCLVCTMLWSRERPGAALTFGGNNSCGRHLYRAAHPAGHIKTPDRPLGHHCSPLGRSFGWAPSLGTQLVPCVTRNPQLHLPPFLMPSPFSVLP